MGDEKFGWDHILGWVAILGVITLTVVSVQMA